MSKEAFFDIIRPLFKGKLNTSVVASFEKFFGVMDGKVPLTYKAYGLATAFHETAFTMMPVTEYGEKSYFNKYDAGTTIGKRLGNTKKGDGYLFRGRGFVQLTGRSNYQRAGEKLGIPLVDEPELACDWDVARKIMRQGMLEGWFTGKKASDYLDKPDYVNARRIINGKDKAETIAGYAKTFEKALKAL